MSDNAIVVQGLVKRFGTVAPLDGVDLEVERGRFSACWGPTARARHGRRALTTIIRPDVATPRCLAWTS